MNSFGWGINWYACCI